MELQALDEFRYRLPQDQARGMRRDVIVYASRHLMEQIQTDQSLALLPGIVGLSLAMPDIRQGYGFPIGGVAALDWQEGVVSPGGVGFEINCGVRMIRTSVSPDEARPRIHDLVNQLFRDIPCGTGGKGSIELQPQELDQVLRKRCGVGNRTGIGRIARCRIRRRARLPGRSRPGQNL
jgi:tRNA-splicing ligase RtcB